MGMPAIAAVDDAAGQELGKKGRSPAAVMADNNNIRGHGLQGQCRVLKAFALVQAGAGLAKGKCVSRQAFACHVKGSFCTGAVFYKKKHDGLTLERWYLLDRTLVDFLKAGGKIQQMADILRTELRYIQQIFVRPVIAGVIVHGCADFGLKKNPLQATGQEFFYDQALFPGTGYGKVHPHEKNVRPCTSFCKEKIQQV